MSTTETTETNNDPTIESIVGEENVVDVDRENETPKPPGGMTCANCSFTTNLLSELEEHVAGTGHGRAPVTDPVQPELFSTPGIIHREINVPMDEEFLAMKRTRLADLYQKALEVKDDKKSADDDFNARLKNIDTQMQEIARVLKVPFTFKRVDCEWRIIDGENARGLYRLDTGEQIETQPLSEEDRVAELARVAEANAEPAEVPAEVEAAPPAEDPKVEEGREINRRNSKKKRGK